MFPRDVNGPVGPVSHPEPLSCRRCGHDDALEIVSIDAAAGGAGTLVAVTYKCTRCGQPCTRAADVMDVAKILNRPEQPAADVLVFGGHYIHCGQPMQATGAQVRNLRTTFGDDQQPAALEVYLATRVLRCPCGFQIEIPDQST